MLNNPTHYTPEELTESLCAINSIIHKCEKAQEKFPEGNSHHTLLRNCLKAMYISKALITDKLAEISSAPPYRGVSRYGAISKQIDTYIKIESRKQGNLADNGLVALDFGIIEISFRSAATTAVKQMLILRC